MAKKKEKEVKSADDRDELLQMVADVLNKSNKDGGKIAHFLGDEENPSEIPHWVSTGSTLLDLAISNRPNGGLPVRRIVEFNGLSGTGKSLLASAIAANTQKMDGFAIVIDTENAAAPEFWASLGVDLDQLLYTQADTVEEIFERIEMIILTLRKKSSDKIITIIVDSVAGASTKAEQESDHGKDGYGTGKALVVSKALRKITNMIGRQNILIVFTNQLRDNLAASAFGDKYVVPGGKAIPYHSSVRVRLSMVGRLKDKTKDVIGSTCRGSVIKNRLGPPLRSADFDIYFDSGIADYSSWIKVMAKNNIIKGGAGGNYTYVDTAGVEHPFKSREFPKWMKSDGKMKEELYGKICDAVIMKYKDPNSEIVEDLTLSTDDDGDDDVN
jgi:recombination protein RecA